MNEDDYLFYLDSGILIFEPVIQKLINSNQDFLAFMLPFIEKEWSKRDAFILMGVDYPEFTDSYQRMGGLLFFRKTDKNIEMVSQWLEYAKDRRIITDDENVMGLPNYDGFQDNRHDQTIFSLLSKKYYGCYNEDIDMDKAIGWVFDRYRLDKLLDIVLEARKPKFDKRILMLTDENNNLKEKIHELEKYNNNLNNNKWYKFGQLSPLQKIINFIPYLLK